MPNPIAIIRKVMLSIFSKCDGKVFGADARSTVKNLFKLFGHNSTDPLCSGLALRTA